MAAKPKPPSVTVATLTHDEATRKNIPTAEYQSVMQRDEQAPIPVTYARGTAGLEGEKEQRNRDLDPQLVWRGKDQQDWSDFVVHAPPLYIQEKVHPKVLIDDLLRRSADPVPSGGAGEQLDLFAEFNGIPKDADRTEFYRHDQNWSNRMILGDSLQVMASLAEREGLRGKVQCIYLDPPYGIKFNSNFQWSTTSRDVKDGNVGHITREPEQVKAFRDTWRDGIHSYLTYLRDRLTVARDLLTDSGSIFVQIGDENVHRVRTVMDEVFGDGSFVSVISFRTTTGLGEQFLDSSCNFLLWYARKKETLKYCELYKAKGLADDVGARYRRVQLEPFSRRSMTADERSGSAAFAPGALIYRNDNLASQSGGDNSAFPVEYCGLTLRPSRGFWKTNQLGMQRLLRAERAANPTPRSIQYVRFLDDFAVSKFSNVWTDTQTGAFTDDKIYVVQTNAKVIERCILMATDPGDLVLDPTCGSGTTAYVAEQWGRRWITIDTSRVALALARARIMGARYPYYLLADSRDGQLKEAEVTRTAPSSQPTRGDIRHGFVDERVPHITLQAIANNTEIDVIWDKWQATLEPLREQLNAILVGWAERSEAHHSPAGTNDGLRSRIDPAERVADPESGYGEKQTFPQMVLENLKVAGVQQARKEDRITFTALTPWPGELVCAEGRYSEGNGETGTEKRAAIFIGPEFGTVTRPDLVTAAREAGDADFDCLIACAFNYEAHATEFNKLGRIPVLKARMNADLHMAEDLKTTGKGNLFVIFGEPDIGILPAADGQVRIKINGVDVFHPSTGEVRSDGPEGIACWLIDTDYNEESFFVRRESKCLPIMTNHPIDPTVRSEIEQHLATIEADHAVRILFACESGSRGWGFASPDSDYDVRFLYVHPLAWYLRVSPPRDVIEVPISGVLDINGWELRKALGLLKKGNSTLVEWLDSPVVYRAHARFLEAIRLAARCTLRPERSFHHYVHMARSNYRTYLLGERVRLKKYLYVLRPLLAARWIEEGRGIAPMRFQDLVDALVTEPALRDAIADLLARKRRALESEHGAPLRVIDDYIAVELARLEVASVPMPRDIDFSVLDRLLLDTVTRAEGAD